MTKDDRDISQLRAQLKDYILDSEAEIRSNLKLGLWRGQNDPIVVKMQKVVDDLIARVREDERQSIVSFMRDWIETNPVIQHDDRDDIWSYGHGVRFALTRIEALGSER